MDKLKSVFSTLLNEGRKVSRKTSKIGWAMFIGVALIMGATSCSNDELSAPDGNTRALAEKPIVDIPAGILPAQFYNLSSANDYRLKGKVYVPANVTMTIPEGTKIMGEYHEDNAAASALVVTVGGKLEAVGTATNPVVFTAENGQKGGWGGVVMLGDAPINQSGPVYIEGIEQSTVPAGVTVSYGGSDATDNSGILKYVRVEFAGAEIGEANELNAFTFGGVGSGTTIEHCQAYYGADDAFEFFGGTVNAKYLVSTATDDDAFDFDFGYCGKIQFAVATIDASMTYSKDPNGIECDNDGNSSSNTPFTRPVLSNLTLVGTVDGQVAGIAGGGTALKSAADFRRNCQFELHNSILYGFPKGIFKETGNSFVCKNNIVSSTTANSEFSTFTPDASNVAKTVAEIGLTSAWGGYKATNLVPTSTSIAASGADFTGLTGFDVVSYKGAAVPSSTARSNWLNATWIK